MAFLFFLACCILLVCVADRMWLHHVARHLDIDHANRAPLFDPEGYLELIARMTELCHGERAQVDGLIAQQQLLHPDFSYGEAVRSAMQQLMAPQGATQMRFND